MEWRYLFFYTAISLVFLFALVSIVDRKPVLFAGSRIIFWIAVTSYSLYLTNQLVIHALWRFAEKTPFLPEAVHLLVSAGVIGATALAFYFAVERPSLAIRHRFMPNRPWKPIPPVPPLDPKTTQEKARPQ